MTAFEKIPIQGGLQRGNLSSYANGKPLDDTERHDKSEVTVPREALK